MRPFIKCIFIIGAISLHGCTRYYPLDPNNPEDYFNFWCDPKNSDGFNFYVNNSNHYEFHADSRFTSKEECLEYYYYGTYGISAVKRKQLDDNLEEQVAEAEERKKKERKKGKNVKAGVITEPEP